jgi:tetratricopeptide (TPR) repeat protein
MAIDSLFGRLAFHPNEFHTLKEIGVRMHYSDPDESARFLDSAYKYAPNDFETYSLRCVIALYDRQLDSAIYYGSLALHQEHTPKQSREVRNNLANAYMYNKQYNAATKVLHSIDSINIDIYNLLGNTHKMNKNLDSARHYYYLVAQHSYDIGNKDYLAFAYANIATTYQESGDTISALGMLMVSLKYSEVHKATVMSNIGDLIGDTTYYNKSLALNPSVYDKMDNYEGMYEVTREGRWLDSLWKYASNSDMIEIRIDSAERAGDYKLALLLERQIVKKEINNVFVTELPPMDTKFDYTIILYFFIFNLAIWALIQKRKYLPFFR